MAALAGVSPTTVSQVINKKGYLSQKTVNKVNKAMRELGYKPNNLARSLQGKSTQLIGLIFPNISNIFYAELIEHLEIELLKQGSKTIICNSEHNPFKERVYLAMLAANQVDVIIVFSLRWVNETDEGGRNAIYALDRKLTP
ncbi:LacI family DNA-binding transcriptional regulator, partial [Staphylococcus pseudintermedius]|nr:LacI family DNA-binding transcriptional regulator [Staphylococcus pseudintermedius]